LVKEIPTINMANVFLPIILAIGKKSGKWFFPEIDFLVVYADLIPIL